MHDPRHTPVARDFFPARLAGGVVLGLVVFALAGALPYPTTDTFAAQAAAGVTAFVAVCWLTGAMPIAAASLAPLALMPLCGVEPLGPVAAAYAHPIIWMFFGGFVLALGIERWGLHRRIALAIIRRVGVKPTRLVLGFMLAAGFLSMWLNNTSTTLMLLPIAMALVTSMRDAGALGEADGRAFAFSLLLGVAYACSIGGVGTPIGTAPNALLLSQYSQFVARGAPPISFLAWLAICVPLVAVFIPVVWLLLTRVVAPMGNRGHDEQARAVIDSQARALPRMDAAERRMVGLFALAALLWITRRDVNLGEFGSIPGWWRLLPIENAEAVGDGSVAIFVALLSFITPSGRRPGKALMDWPTARQLPWDILLLIGGGISIANAFQTTGLSTAIGTALHPLAATLPPAVLLIVACTVMTCLTEFTSNTATTALLLPIFTSMSAEASVDPRLLMFAATLSASCAFMLPIATPPNAIVFASGHIPMRRMALAGIWVNLMGVVLITAAVWFLAVPVLGIDVSVQPAWATAVAPVPAQAH